MPKCIELLPCDRLISNLCYQAIEQVYLIKWPVSVFTIFVITGRQPTHLIFSFTSICRNSKLGGKYRRIDSIPKFEKSSTSLELTAVGMKWWKIIYGRKNQITLQHWLLTCAWWLFIKMLYTHFCHVLFSGPLSSFCLLAWLQTHSTLERLLHSLCFPFCSLFSLVPHKLTS